MFLLYTIYQNQTYFVATFDGVYQADCESYLQLFFRYWATVFLYSTIGGTDTHIVSCNFLF
jgi:hypothetical protein